ncbi:MAG: DNA-directed RNA polymerase subunit beta [Planctomycetes bacterium]|nr:DNA-directed RNA polymerase subunit beta [Planctomycetota bacterium]
MRATANVPEAESVGRVKEIVEVPNLVELQTRSYADFLQAELPYGERKNLGLESILREVFPIKSFNGEMSLEYVGYELGRPRYMPEECRRLRLTYGAPFKVRVRLEKEEPVEEEVYLGEVPLMLGGGEFIINGAERVIVTQLHRSPGVDFSVDIQGGERKMHSCWIIPERGSWIELNVNKKDALQVRIDQSGKFPCTSLLRALDAKFSTDADILNAFYRTKNVSRTSRKFREEVTGKRVVTDVVNPETGEILCEALEVVSEGIAGVIAQSAVESVAVIEEIDDPLILNSVAEDTTNTHEEALLKIYGRLRPGNPPNIEKARELFREKFYDPARYRLGKVGRFRLNRKFGLDIPETEQTLLPEDIINCIKYLLRLRKGDGEIDDIDHLGNRRVRSIMELAADELRKGFLKLRRTVQERMNMEEPQKLTPRALINSKTISSAIEYFFGRGELSQVVDQTNPLSQLTHERRLSALGPGGLNRKRAGFEVRDVHISHYGRICPIETPEGTNIGLISSLAIYAGCDDYGFLVTPYRVVRNGKITEEIRYLRADEENDAVLAPADAPAEGNRLHGPTVLARKLGDFVSVELDEVQYMDVSPRQVIGVSAALIPFLEHDDANRALMGSNMQRQAVPLIWTDPPVVGTGMESHVARHSGMVVVAEHSGTVTYVDATRIMVDEKEYRLRKFTGLNERTCLNQQPCVAEGQKVKKGQVIADGGGVHKGELALGKNVLVAFMSWEGYNFEDAIIVSESLLKRDVYTSIHIEEFEIEIRETKLGREEFTRDIPNVSEKALRNLDETGVIRIGTRVKPGDVLVGKVAPKSKSELSPEEKLLHAIFGRAGEDVKNDSLEVPPGVEGIVIDAEKFTRKVNVTEDERQRNLQEIKRLERGFTTDLKALMRECVEKVQQAYRGKLQDPATGKAFAVDEEMNVNEVRDLRDRMKSAAIHGGGTEGKERALRVIKDIYDRIDTLENEKNKRVNRLSRGDELPTGVLEMVRVYIASKRHLSVGDKMAGRHGNKGVVSRILAEEDMPYLEDGTPVDIILNPLGVPSRMNVGQILETHLGWASKRLGRRVSTPAFDGCAEQRIEELLAEAGLPRTGKVRLHDGRTGEPTDQEVTVGIIYMLKLHHLVDDKVHARATGPYSLITQQPLGGKARFGGQRFGEMEVWALEAYGAAHVLQELLTVKSDDVDGRTKIYESMVKGTNILEAGTPVSFEVLCNEIKGLALNIELEKRVL